MRVTEITPSLEPCAEAGWHAYYYHVDGILTAAWVERLRGIGGSWLLMKSLKSPFFKIENHYYMVKGLLGNDFLRVAVHSDHDDELKRIENYINELHDND